VDGVDGDTNIMPITPIAGTAFDATGVIHRHLLRADNDLATTITIGSNPAAAWSEDLSNAPYFSVVQRGLNPVTVVGAGGVVILPPPGFLPVTRGQGSVITLTGDKVATGGWLVSGDMAPS